MVKEILLKKLLEVERISSLNKFSRMMNHPAKYLFSILHRKLVYPFTKKEIIINAKLFTGQDTTIALPASTDIFLTGGKSHISEIKLARFLIHNLTADSIFLDIGAHYGYFSLITSQIISEGHIYAFEPTDDTYKILYKNTQHIKSITSINKAISEGKRQVDFYEFDNLHSEYNTATVEQFENSDWIQTLNPEIKSKSAISITDFCHDKSIVPDIIKIDVEGFEYEVISGIEKLLNDMKPIIIIEYLEPKRGNLKHKKALDILKKHGYISHMIQRDGNLIPVTDIDDILEQQGLESDNIVCIAHS